MDRPLPLNLPPAALDLRRTDAGLEVYDVLRHKFVALTPEEWVRQHFTSWMISELGYPQLLMANEVAIRLNGTLRRCDTVVYRREALKPLMVVEYKAPHVAVTQRVFDQIARYNMIVGAPYLAVSNGLSHYVCRLLPSGPQFLPGMPRYADLLL